MAGESLIIGNGNWGVKSDAFLGYAINNSKYVPRDLTFTRATTGTRVNASGLVETTPYNLLTYSEQFDNAAWSKSRTVVLPNAIAAPTGLVTADLVQSSDNTNVQSIYQSYTGTISGNFSLSFYVKKKEVNIIQIEFFPSPYSVEYGVNIDLTTNAYVNWPNAVDSCIVENIGTDGWKRITITKNIPTTTAMYVQLFLASTLNGVPREICTLPVGSGIYLWGAQLVENSSALTYFPTTTRANIPRVDYSTGTAALLLEPQRTNISTGSENMGASWLPIGGTLTPNSTTSPSGLLNAAKLTVTTANGYAYRDIVTVASTVYTFSVYIRSATGSDVNGALNAGAGSINFVANNTWQRFSLTFTASAALTTFYIGGYGTLSSGEDIYVWGAQVEEGPNRTSYIPTTSATVTRNADAIGKSGFQAAGLLTPTQNTFFFNLAAIGTTGTNYNFLTFTATSGLPIAIWRFAGSQNFHIQISGIFTDTGVASGKFAVVQNGSQTKLFVNGVLNTTGGATGTIDALVNNIGIYPLSTPTYIKALSMYPTALSDAECIALTT